jgi:hypothetical protein
VALLAATFGIVFVLAVAFLAAIFSQSVPLVAAGVVWILLILGVIAVVTLVGRRGGDVHRDQDPGI